MPLLLDADYAYLKECGLEHQEDEAKRYFVIDGYPVPEGMYVSGGQGVDHVEILLRIPANYNTTGGDMFWVYPGIERADGKTIPQVATGPGQGPGHKQSSHFQGKEYWRWSRHYDAKLWKPGVDVFSKLLNRVEWALRNPDADK